MPGTLSHSTGSAATTPGTLPNRSSNARAEVVEIPWNGGKHRLGCFVSRLRSRSLRVGRAVRRRLDLLATDGEAMDPERRVTLVAAPQERDPLVDHGEARATNAGVVQRSAGDVCPLHEEIREGAGSAKLAELRPQSALEHCSVEVEDAFAFDERVRADCVVAGWERGDLDLGAEFAEGVGDSALALVDVDDDLHRGRGSSGFVLGRAEELVDPLVRELEDLGRVAAGEAEFNECARRVAVGHDCFGLGAARAVASAACVLRGAAHLRG